MLKLIVVWALAALFAVYSAAVTARANYNTGTLLLWLCSAALVAYGILHKHIDAFCERGFGRFLKGLFFLGLAVYAVLFVFVAVSGYANNAKGDERSIVVLGAGLRGERIGDVLRRRMRAALAAWQLNPDALVVVTGGQGRGESIPEAEAMCKWLLERGVPRNKILVEAKSTSTEENLLFARQLLARKGIGANEAVAVVTNAFHCYRAGKYARMLGFEDVRAVPASMTPLTLLPSYLREVLAILYMWVFRQNGMAG